LRSGLNVDGSWLYAGGGARVVRFDTESDSPGDADIFFPAPHKLGFIVIKGNTFSISVSEPWDSAQLEYKKGVLTETCLPDSEGGLGSFHARSGERMTFVEAISTALCEVGCETLGIYCTDLLTNPTNIKTAETVYMGKGHPGSSSAVMGKGHGALQKFTEVTPLKDLPGKSKRIVCTFTVLVGSRK